MRSPSDKKKTYVNSFIIYSPRKLLLELKNTKWNRSVKLQLRIIENLFIYLFIFFIFFYAGRNNYLSGGFLCILIKVYSLCAAIPSRQPARWNETEGTTTQTLH